MNQSSMSGQHLLGKIREVDPKDLTKARQEVKKEVLKQEKEVLKQEMKHIFDSEPPSRVTYSERVRAETTEQFMAGMDIVTDVLLIMMMKFGRAATLLRTALFVLFGCLIALTISLLALNDQANKIEDISLRVERVEHQQRYLSQETKETATKVDQTKKKVDEAANEIKGQPKLEVVQEKGQTKLLIKRR